MPAVDALIATCRPSVYSRRPAGLAILKPALASAALETRYQPSRLTEIRTPGWAASTICLSSGVGGAASAGPATAAVTTTETTPMSPFMGRRRYQRSGGTATGSAGYRTPEASHVLVPSRPTCWRRYRAPSVHFGARYR